MVSRVLVTGFLPFAGAEQNISAEIARQFGEGGLTSVELGPASGVQFEAAQRQMAIEFEHRILTVDLCGASEIAAADITGYDALIHLGLASDGQQIKIETRAENLFQFRFADESGRLRTAGPILENQPDFLLSSASMDTLRAEFDSNPLVIFSNDAGGFICNETYFRTLAAHRNIAGFGEPSKSDGTAIHDGLSRAADGVEGDERAIPILFIHLPTAEHIGHKIQADIVAQIVAVTLAKPRINVVGAVIEHQGNILCCRRANGEKKAGFWEFPGGKIKAGESEEEALSREIEEELSIKISPQNSIRTVEHQESNQVIHITFWRAQINVGEPILTVHDEYKWLPPERLSELKWLTADASLIEHLQH